MGRYDSHKHPFQSRLGQWGRSKVNDFLERQAKSVPCHVVEVAKDFIKVAFETSNGISTPPVVKLPQQFSQFSREPTQMGNKGYAVPGSYYLGGVTGDSGGNTNFYPRGNLTTLSFNPVSHTQNRERDYDQLTHMGGPNGWNIGAFSKQAGDSSGGQQGGGGGGQTSTAVVSRNIHEQKYGRARRMNVHRSIMAKTMGVSVKSLSTPIVAPRNGATGGGGGSSGGNGQQQSQQPSDKTTYNFDKNGMCTIQSKDDKHNVTVDQASQKITLNLPIGEWGYAGGDGKEGKYARIMTESGPSKNFKARIG
jgi:hypothetical protein